MAVIKAQKIPRPELEFHPDEVIGRFCYYFPQYTFAQAKRMPLKVINKMLKLVEREKAKDFLFLTRIVGAPHSKNGNLYKSLIEYFKGVVEGVWRK